MPILVRPVREQLEHDRIIRLLEAKWRRKFKVEANPGDERNAGVKVPAGTLYPDLVLTEEGGRKPKALIEVETNESVNHLEAMAQWANLAKARTSLILFVPVGAVEAARRLSHENSIKLTELWTYHVLGDQVRFTSVFREHGAEPADLIEKVEVFMTERSAPAPRPVPVEPEAAAPPAAEPERPRKLAVKAGVRSAAPDDAVTKVAVALGKAAGKLASKIGAKGAVPEPPAAPAKIPPPKVPAAAQLSDAPKPQATPKPEATPRPQATTKPQAKSMAPVPTVQAVTPARSSAPAKSAAPKSPEKGAEKPAKPAEKVLAKPAGKPVDKLAPKPAAKPAEKVVARKPPARPEVRKVVAKPAPAKAAVPAKKVVGKPAPRPVARKAVVPVRPAARPANGKKPVAAAVAKAGSAKRK